ncbi:MAG: hypothetical protein RBT53_08635 [Azonexus sp.]|nr:hypothetical protein [Azonexus sp.]
MAKPNYQFEKRQRDLAKKQKQEEKRQQKLANKTADPEAVQEALNEDIPLPDQHGGDPVTATAAF